MICLSMLSIVGLSHTAIFLALAVLSWAYDYATSEPWKLTSTRTAFLALIGLIISVLDMLGVDLCL